LIDFISFPFEWVLVRRVYYHKYDIYYRFHIISCEILRMLNYQPLGLVLLLPLGATTDQDLPALLARVLMANC